MLRPPFLPECFIMKLGSSTTCPSHSMVGIHFGCPSTLCFFLPISEVRDLLMHVSHRSTTINYFGSLGFGSFNLSPLDLSQSDFT
jgi:hypothetical protein